MDYTGQRITVMGLGRFGGGVGVTRFLSQRGAVVTVTDTATEDQLADSVTQVRDLPNVSLVLGEHREQDFRPTHTDLVVANPAVKPTNKFLQIAHDAGVPVTTEIVLLVRELPNRLRTTGVTGSAGKSTTTAMIAHILRKALGQESETPRRQGAKTPSGPDASPGVWMGGNIGGSLLPVVDQIQEDDWVVLELSSFMLHYLREEQWSPHVAVITNISPNHLDWHGTFEDYVESKCAIYQYQVDKRDKYILTDSPALPKGRGCGGMLPVSGFRFETPLKVPGRHNQANAMFAVATACDCFLPGVDLDFCKSALSDFAGLPHRLCCVGNLFGSPIARSASVECINDSKSTTPDAAILGIEAFGPGTVHVIIGGSDKGSDLSEMCRVAAERCAGVYTIGSTGNAIAEAVEGFKRSGPCRPGRATGDSANATEAGDTGPTRPGSQDAPCVVRCGTLEKAVAAIRERVKPGEVVLLSPGCASWDQFDNYEERGERFIELVRGKSET